jgi:ATP synthase protein I
MAQGDDPRSAPSAPDDGSKVKKAYTSFSVAAVGLEMGVSVALGLAIGYFLDREFDTAPYLTIVFLLFGTAAGFKALFRAARQTKSASGESNE